MNESIFDKIKAAIAADPARTLPQLGIILKKGVKGEWSAGNCMLCADTSGSASYTHEAYLKCPQCGTKKDVFEWRGELEGGKLWDVALRLAAEFSIEIPKREEDRKRRPNKMTAEILAEATNALATAPEAEVARVFLAKRGFDNPTWWARLGIGFLNGTIIFAQFTPEGELRPRYRIYQLAGKVKWLWSSAGGKDPGLTVGWWTLPELMANPPEETRLLVLEGEWDVMTAIVRLELHKQGWLPVTWTGGAGAPIPAHLVPKPWMGLRVHLCYDNDTFQGPIWTEHRAPNTRKRLEMELRRKAFLEGVAGSFQANACDVLLRAIPIDPLKQFGADFRDWVDEGGRDIDELPCFELKDCLSETLLPVEVDFEGVYAHANRVVDFEANVCTVEDEGLTVPKTSELICPMGHKTCCKTCDAPTKFPDKIIDWAGYQDHLANMLVSKEPERYALEKVVGKPRGCAAATLKPLNYVTGARWTAISSADDSTGQRELTIVSKEVPTLSGNVNIIGRVHHVPGTVIVLAKKVHQVDTADIDLSEFKELKEMTPGRTDDLDRINAYIEARTADLSCHVTKIYGRPDVHVAHDLMMHSAIQIPFGDKPTRGWIDIAVIGNTRTGKSLTFRRLFEHHKLGSMHTCVENISRAGLTMGAAPGGIAGKSKLRPGLYPRQDRKALILDEWHLMIEKSQDNPMEHLQSARDEGKVHGVKIYGARSLVARVRLTCIGNWARGDRYLFRYACQHFLYLYGKPEMLSRCDFGVIIHDAPDELELPDVPHRWTSELTRALILRAWSMDEDKIRIAEDAVELANEQCEAWREVYSYEELPIFTPEEKPVSILRIAVACANMVYSHPLDDEYSCEVRLVHVQWAIQWLKHVWKESGYEAYSKWMLSNSNIAKPFKAESLFTTDLKLEDPSDAATILNMLLGRYSVNEIVQMVGKEPYKATAWTHGLMRLNAIKKDRSTVSMFHVEYMPTKAGSLLLRNLVVLAEDYPHLWKQRYVKMESWVLARGKGAAPGLPLTLPLEELREHWDEQPDDTQNLFEGPGA